MKGRCLCGDVEFNISIDVVRIYQCFCSLCQKQSGTESNLATIVPDSKFSFVSGSDLVTSWIKDTGFTSHFCRCCGSPVPNRLRNKAYFWVPVGLLDQGVKGEVVSHIYTSSKINIVHSHDIEEFDEFPTDNIDGHIKNISSKS